ncbi:Protein phosphatase 2C 2 [Vanrija albida]|uniref:protein-serine/threonine phosphatase n=1 Tax=Vanrija albida TaxID=181172 RepID=A0ABR3PRX5_9TREE
MGQTLSEPVTEKHTTTVLRQKQFWVGLSDMQGWRISMEDSHSVHLYLPPGGSTAPPSAQAIPEQPAGSTVSNDGVDERGPALAGVFDGHGGSTVAKFTGTTLHTRIANLDAYKSGDYEVALKQAFLKTDEDLRADPTFFNDPSGCTAVVGLITPDGRIIVANAGDSRAVLGYKGEAKALSNDHKPTNKEETARITAAGGFVEFGRVNGNLALSRAIGDFEFKQNYTLQPEQQIVTADPEIITHNVDGEEEFIVLACDGIWDCLSSQQVIDFVRRAVANGDGLSKICEDLMVKCLATDSETGGIGCDNMTVVIVALLGGRTQEEWQAWVKDRVDNKVGRDTPESIPDVFGQAQPGLSAAGPGGFRISGAGGMGTIASILSASGFSFRAAGEDDDEELHIVDTLDEEGHGATLHSIEDHVDDDGDSHMDSGEESDATAAVGEQGQARTPAFSSIGSPTVPTPESLQPARSSSADEPKSQ